MTRYRILTVLLLAGLVVIQAAEGDVAELVQSGQRIYRQGILPDGSPLVAERPEGFTLEGDFAACVVCHRRSGMGSVEGNVDRTVLVPPITGAQLQAGARYAEIPLDPSHHYIPTLQWRRAISRSAYDRSSLGRALRESIAPDGNTLLSPMPRYDLDDTAVAALSAYLDSLTRDPAPGVEPDVLHLATVVAASIDPQRVEAVVDVLDEWSDFASGSGVPWKLHKWRLTGPASGWAAQLDDYYRRQPVFALLSGIGSSEWRPVHEFCEAERIPCVLPSVDALPAIGTDWYSVYYSPGVKLEADIVSEFIDRSSNSLPASARIVQLYADPAGRIAVERTGVASSGLAERIETRRFHQAAPRAALAGLVDGDLLLLWLRPDEIRQLLVAFPQPPVQRIFLSAMLAPPGSLRFPAAWKRAVAFVSLFDDLGLQGELARHRLDLWLENAGLDGNPHRRLQADAYAAGYLLNAALGSIRKQEIRRFPVPLNREHLLETLEILIGKNDDSTDLIETESHVAWYGRMSLGPRQRVAVRGGTILGYRSDDSDRLGAISNRIVP